MCIIVAKPAGAVVTLDTLKNCWTANPDGAGLAVTCEGKVEIIKGLMTWAEFVHIYDDPEFWRDMPMLIHFRIATHGNVDEENTHPFEVVPQKVAFAHNGVFPGMTVPHRGELSDTQVFNRYILKQLPQNFLKNAALRKLIGMSIGLNKLAFLDSEGEITIFNKGLGHVRQDGVWFSTNDYLGSMFSGGWHYSSRSRGWVCNTDYDIPEKWPASVATVDDADAGVIDADEFAHEFEEEDEFYCWDCAEAFIVSVDPLFSATYTPACPNCGDSHGVELFEEAYNCMSKYNTKQLPARNYRR